LEVEGLVFGLVGIIILILSITIGSTEFSHIGEKESNLFSADSFECEFKNGIFSWSEKGEYETKKWEGRFTLIYNSINHFKRTAKLIGGYSSSKITTYNTGASLTMIEKNLSGSFNATSIHFPNEYDRMPGSKYHAVHSRHIARFAGEPMQSQYYGYCKIHRMNHRG